MSDIAKVISDNIYWVIFISALLDHNGVSIPIVTVGMFNFTGTVRIISLFLVMNASLLLVDAVLLVFGTYFRKRDQQFQNLAYKSPSIISSLEKKILYFGRSLLKREAILFYLFGKFIPFIGKFLPFFMGYKEGWNKRNLAFLFIGNNIYILTFYLLGIFFGRMVVKYSVLTAILLFLLFIIIYTLLVRYRKPLENRNVN
ncbi:hypothetical protein [Bacillus massilinigeriensis]|uniref:hypothetical protein n=1 Tax=Bacillus massilionigeriensis TaxID=1805475 RepID=UPI00096AF7D7|nr:hypothetical protein [Bacillus massilionigeriensis]